LASEHNLKLTLQRNWLANLSLLGMRRAKVEA